ncbi:hypothetical protein D3C80_2095300 [compost metagenome]
MAERTEEWIIFYAANWRMAAEYAGGRLQEDVLGFVDGKKSSLSGDADMSQLQMLYDQFIHL